MRRLRQKASMGLTSKNAATPPTSMRRGFRPTWSGCPVSSVMPGHSGAAAIGGTCPWMRADRSYPAGRYRGCPFNVTMKVRFANPGDAEKMQPGQIVTLVGDVAVSTDPRTVPVTAPRGNFRTHISYLVL